MHIRLRFATSILVGCAACAQGTGVDPSAVDDDDLEQDASSIVARDAAAERDGGTQDASAPNEAPKTPDGGTSANLAPEPDASTHSPQGADARVEEAGPPGTEPPTPPKKDAGAAVDAARPTTPARDAAPPAPPKDAATNEPRDAEVTPPEDASEPERDAGNEPATFAYQPSNVDLAGIDFANAPVAVLDCGTTQLDTSNAVSVQNWCGNAPKPIVRAQGNGPELVIVPLRGLTLANGSTLRIVGTRPVAFVVNGVVSIVGTLEASARGTTRGPGADFMCGRSQGGNGTGNSGNDGAGGGGGGFGTEGGRGGSDTGNATRGAAGATRGSATLVPLLGGCSGGRGGACDSNAGAGGGAVQISASETLTVSGTIRASGSEGQRGCVNDSGGGGGGSGGAILLEGERTVVGGATLRAEGGQGGESQGGVAGGNGASNANAAGAAGRDGNGSGGGGAGGGYGRIRTRGNASCSGC